MPVDFDGPAIVEVLSRHDGRYVLIGGFAAVAHGSPVLRAMTRCRFRTMPIRLRPPGSGT